MKKSTLSILSLILLFGILSTPAFSQSKKADKYKEMIRGINEKLATAIVEDDHEYIISMYVDDVISLPSYTPMIRGKEALIEHEKKNHEAGFKMQEMRFEVVDVMLAGGHVIEIGKYFVTMEMPMSEEPMKDYGKYVTVWEIQDDGSLKIKLETWNTDTNPWMMSEGKEKDQMEKK